MFSKVFIKIVFISLIVELSFISCKKSNSLSSADRNTVTEDGTVRFKELLILLDIKTSDSTYLVIKSIDSVDIYINNYYWSKVSSEPIDTTKINKYQLGNMFVSPDKINYLVISQQDIGQPDYTTAGEFAAYLNASYTLDPGDYVCYIKSFKVTFNDNTTKKYYPYKYQSFKIEDNTTSSFVGEIELTIN